MSLSDLAEYHFSKGKRCSKCRKPIRNSNTTGLCYECLYGYKFGYKKALLKTDDEADLKLLIEDE